MASFSLIVEAWREHLDRLPVEMKNEMQSHPSTVEIARVLAAATLRRPRLHAKLLGDFCGWSLLRLKEGGRASPKS